MFRRVAIASLFLTLCITPLERAFAQTQICATDLDGDGDADSRDEQGVCSTSAAGNLCPIESVACSTSVGTPPPIAMAAAIGTIINDDGRSGGTFGVESQSVTEGTGGNISAAVSVNFAPVAVGRVIEVTASSMTATAGIDFLSPVRQTLAPNVSRLTFLVPIVADALPENLEAFRVTVWDAANPVGTVSWGEIRIIDDDAPAPGAGISIGQAWRDEGNAGTTTLNFPVTMSAASADTVTVDFLSADVTAQGGSDYTPVTGTVRFDPGVLAQTIQVPIVGDVGTEGDETFTVTLSNATASGSAAVCPLNPARACLPDGAGGSRCSLHDCFLRSDVGGVIVEPPSVPPNDDGPRDAAGNCLGEMQIFPGMYNRCRRVGTQTQFSNCCRNRGDANDSMGSSGSGGQTEVIASISASAGLLTQILGEPCDNRDIQTAIQKDSGYCVFLGEYCSEEWALVGCVQRAQGYCCYNSMLGRIINEQGRGQVPSMGGFGTPEEPNCRGFSPDEFQALDFSKIDLSEYFAEIRSKNLSLIEGEIRPRINQQIRGGQ